METAIAWEWALEGVTDASMMWAARQIVDEQGRKFFPTPNELRSYLPGRTPQPRMITGSKRDDDEHWSEEAIQKRNAILREVNGKLNAEYARRFPAVWGERPNFNR